MTEVVLENINAAYQEDEVDKTRGKTSLNMRYSVAANRAASSNIINTTINTRTNGQVLKNYVIAIGTLVTTFGTIALIVANNQSSPHDQLEKQKQAFLKNTLKTENKVTPVIDSRNEHLDHMIPYYLAELGVNSSLPTLFTTPASPTEKTIRSKRSEFFVEKGFAGEWSGFGYCNEDDYR